MSDQTIHGDTAGPVQVPTRITETIWFNAVWFQSLWFCTVLGRESLLLVAFALLGMHLWLCGNLRREVKQLVLVGGIGILADAALSATNVYVFANNALVPLWLCCLWFGFSAAMSRSLGWLSGRLTLCIIAGAVAFPLNYWAGERLGAVEFGYSLPVTLTVLALCWAILLPLMYTVIQRLERGKTGRA